MVILGKIADFYSMIRGKAKDGCGLTLMGRQIQTFLGLLALSPAASQFGRKLIAGHGGIVIRKFWGRTIRCRYPDLTKAEVCFWGRRAIMNFYKGGERIGGCESTDENFEKLLSSLLEIMPERVIFNRQGL